MKKKELTKLIEDKKLLKETIEIMDEVGGYDNMELKLHDRVKAINDLTMIFHSIDSTSHRLVEILRGGLLGDNELENGEKVLKNFYNFMESFNNFLADAHESHQSDLPKIDSEFPDPTEFPGSIDNKHRMNENK